VNIAVEAAAGDNEPLKAAAERTLSIAALILGSLEDYPF
jgi:hypothetical protein